MGVEVSSQCLGLEFRFASAARFPSRSSYSTSPVRYFEIADYDGLLASNAVKRWLGT